MIATGAALWGGASGGDSWSLWTPVVFFPSFIFYVNFDSLRNRITHTVGIHIFLTIFIFINAVYYQLLKGIGSKFNWWQLRTFGWSKSSCQDHVITYVPVSPHNCLMLFGHMSKAIEVTPRGVNPTQCARDQILQLWCILPTDKEFTFLRFFCNLILLPRRSSFFCDFATRFCSPILQPTRD